MASGADDIVEPPRKRFRHQSYKSAIREVHLPSAVQSTQLDEDLAENETHFRNALDVAAQLNLSPAFVSFISATQHQAASIPLLLLHADDIVERWRTAVGQDEKEDEGLAVLIELLPALLQDLRTTLKPRFDDLVHTLTAVIPRPQLSPRALTAVLAALASVLRLLQPDEAMLARAHAALLHALRKCSPEVQSAAADVWGAVLRRAKGPAREAVVRITLAPVRDDGEGVAAFVGAHAFVAACKNVSQSLHTSAAPLVTLLLDQCDNPNVATLARRLLTSLSHFCAAPTIKDGVQVAPSGFSPVADALIANNLAALPVIAHVVAVRKGNRFSKDQIAALASQLAAQSVLLESDEHRHDQLKLASALLLSGDMTSWSAVARPLIDWAWAAPPLFALELSGALAQLGWTGWKAVGLPVFARRVPALVATEADERTARFAVRVLAELCTRGLAPAADDAPFWDALGAYVDRRLEGWTLSEDNVVELNAMLKLTPVLRRVEAKLGLVIGHLLDSDCDMDTDGCADAGWVLGRCFDALARTPGADAAPWAPRVLANSRWTRDAHAMAGFVALVQASSANVTLPLDAALPALRAHKHALRLAALHLLAAPAENAAVRHMLAAEECTLDVAGARARTVRIAKLPALLGTRENVLLGIAWLLGQLKVNLRPVWEPAGKALAELAAQWGEEVWEAVWAELEHDYESDAEVGRRTQDEDAEEEVHREAERTWRCPAGANTESAVRRWRADGTWERREVLKEQRPKERLDGTNYTSQLLRTLALVPALAEKHSRLLVPRFLALAHANLKGRLGAYLALFARFGNPKALFRTAELHAVYLQLLAHPDRAVQRDALACVQTYRAPAVARLGESLKGLLDETRWRDEMVALTTRAGDGPAMEDDAEEVLVRVCYGLMTERRAGRERRAAALTLVGALGERAMGVLVGLMLAPFERAEGAVEEVPAKQQMGFLAMLGDVLSALGTSTMAYWPRLLDATLACLAAAQRKLDAEADADAALDQEQEQEQEQDDSTPSGALRAVRLAGLKRLADFFRVPVPPAEFDFAPYVARAFAGAISPRLPAFDRENTQAPSALLQMFAAWTAQRHTVRFLVAFDGAVLPKTFALLAAPSVKPAVVARVLDVADRILALADEGEDGGAEVAEEVLLPHVGALLDGLAALVARSTAAGKGALGELAQRQIAILSRVAGHVRQPEQAAALLALFEPLLRRPPRIVGEKVKTDLLKIYVELVPRIPELGDKSSRQYIKTYELLAGLFSMLRMRSARAALAAAFIRLCGEEDSVAKLVEEMNAFSAKRIEEPDFERRLKAFATLNEDMHARLDAREWLPVLHNLLFFVQDTEELSLRQNAAFGLTRFIDRVASNDQEILLVFTRVVYPALKRSLRSQSEMVRAEVLRVIAFGVETCDNVASLKEMRGLLAGGDEEANFFNNICHIQVHRRTRALRRLSEYVDTGAVGNATLAQIFLPLLGHPIYNSGTTDHLLVNEAIAGTGIVAKHFSWVSYYALVQQYQKMIKEAKEKVPVKPLVRALVAVLDNFHFPMDASVGEAETRQAAGDDADEDEAPAEVWKADSRIMDAVSVKLLPSLLSILENREETEDGLRIPIMIGIVRIALFLPEAQRRPQVSRLLTVASQIFRSKSQDTRDLTRETLCKIVVMLGPDYLAETMKQLRGALLRGPHLHILAFVTHAILVHVTTNASEQFADLDAAVADIVHVAAEVIFGQSGKDVMSEDFKTKLKEVRGSSSRGLDTFALLSKCISPAKLSTLLLPVRTIMEETESAKVMLQVDDVLRRVASGLNSNPKLKPADLLIMCHTLISQNAKFLTQTAEPSKRRDKVHRDIEVKLKRTVDAPTSHYVNNSHRFIALGLDVFVTAARRSKFSLQDPDTVARLEPMVTVIGNTLYSRNANVLVLALKAAAAVIKFPLKNVDKALPVLVRQIVDIIKQGGTTESEVAQTALKTLATVMRDKTSSQLKEKDLTFLLDLLGPDLEEHERQASVFAILRAIVSRKFIVPEIYDMMDRVAQVMVTSQSPQVQELCRGVLLQFYLDYPQGKGRLQKQMNFLAKNLSYVFESGRKSVMELLGAILAKFDPALMNEYATLFFVALVMVLANDDSPTCREMAAALIKTLFQVLDEPRRSELVTLLQSWSTQSTKPQLVRVSIQVLGVVIDTLKEDASAYVPLISSVLRSGIEGQAERLAEAETDTAADGLDELDWQLPYQLLTVLAKLLRTFPAFTPSVEKTPWPSIVALLLFPHAWVRTAAARLIGTLYATQPPAAPSARLPEGHPLSATGMAEVARKSCLQLRGDTLDAQLSVQVTKNLVYIGKCYSQVSDGANGQDDDAEGDESDGGEEEEEKAEAEPSRPTGQLNWLFSRLSHQARGAVVARRSRTSTTENWTEQPASVMKFFAAMASFMAPAQTARFLLHILAPVQRVLDEDTIADAAMDALKTLAAEVQDLVQKQVGTTAFTEVYSRLRNKAMAVRRERKEARALMVATDPQRAARRKAQHGEVKKESKKRKGREFREGRAGFAKKARVEF